MSVMLGLVFGTIVGFVLGAVYSGTTTPTEHRYTREGPVVSTMVVNDEQWPITVHRSTDGGFRLIPTRGPTVTIYGDGVALLAGIEAAAPD